jgi:hypothetical protein
MLLTNQTPQDYWFGPLHLLGGVGQTLTVDDTTATSLYLSDDGVADAINTLYASGKVLVSSYALPFPRPTGDPLVYHGDGSPEGLVYAGQGSIYLRRDAAIIYQKTTGIHLNTGWVSAITTNPKVTAALYSAGPPANPTDGDEWVALAVDTGNLSTTNGTVWRFRYNAQSSSAYKWEAVGQQQPVYGEIDASEGTATTSYTDLSTVGPSITVARAGDYDITIGANISPNTGLGTLQVSFAWGANAAADADSVYAIGWTGDVRNLTRNRRKTLAASDLVRMKYKCVGSPGPANCAYRRLEVRPVRIS